jgi:hypothetical protein
LQRLTRSAKKDLTWTSAENTQRIHFIQGFPHPYFNQGGLYAYSEETSQESSQAGGEESRGEEASLEGEEKSPGQEDCGEKKITETSFLLSAEEP